MLIDLLMRASHPLTRDGAVIAAVFFALGWVAGIGSGIAILLSLVK